MGPDLGARSQPVNAGLTDRVGSLDPGPLIQREGRWVPRVRGGIECELPEVAERAISCGIETLSTKEPEVSTGVTPGGRDPSGSGHIGRRSNSLGPVVSGSTCCSLGPANPGP